MEEGKSILTEYEPFDTSNIKAVYVRSEKELEAEAASICELLKDISKCPSTLMTIFIESDWDKRLKAILSI